MVIPRTSAAGITSFACTWVPAFAVYFSQRRWVVLILLCGGDKSTQSRDIAPAKRLPEELNVK